MKKLILSLLACTLSLCAGERKPLTFEQAYLNRGEALLKPLPEIDGWLDGYRFSEIREVEPGEQGKNSRLLLPAARRFPFLQSFRRGIQTAAVRPVL